MAQRVPNVAPTPKTDLTLEKAFREQNEALRPLRKYKLHYANPDFPVLSFLYAVMAGGEYTLYCDHTADYVQAYLTGRLAPAGVAKISSVMARLEAARGEDPPPYPTPAEWKTILDVLLDELTDPNAPRPMPLW